MSSPRSDSALKSWIQQRPTPLQGVHVLGRKTHADERGDFSRLYCSVEFGTKLFAGMGIAQSNIARNRLAGTVRGLHLMLPPAQEHKHITCVRGSIWDVAVDLRPDSPTFMRWFGIELRADENLSIIIPPGVGHGYQTLEPESTVLYQHSEKYTKNLDAGVRVDDPDLAISWPLQITVRSTRDSELPSAIEYVANLA